MHILIRALQLYFLLNPEQEIIRKENQDIYRRIEKMENEEGFFTKERREHIARVESKLRYLRKLKDHDRVVQVSSNLDFFYVVDTIIL